MEETKIKLLRTLDILKETDEEHPLTAKQICKKLELEGFEAERKSISRNINALIEYYDQYSDENYEIMGSKDTRKGYFMNSRNFEDWELKVLIDAVWQARFLTEERSKSLSQRLRMMASCESRKVLQNVTPVKSHAKTSKHKVAEHIDKLLRAIKEGRKVVFEYESTDTNMKRHSRFDGKEYLINPYALKWNGDRYYLVCNYDKYDDLSFYRLDRIANLRITDMPVKPAKEVVGDNPSMKIEAFVSKSMYSYGGESVRLVLCIKPFMVDELVDYFGEDLKFRENGSEDEFEVHVSVNNADGLYYWLLQHGENVKVVSPEPVRDELLRRIDKIRSLY
jgi:predicted DNA-binding transcriptional regulator YafY